MSCQNQHFLCNIIPIGHLKDPFLDKQSPTILMTLNILMTIRFFFIDNLSLKLKKKSISWKHCFYICRKMWKNPSLHTVPNHKTCTTMRHTSIRFFKLWHLFLSIQIVEHVFRNNLGVQVGHMFDTFNLCTIHSIAPCYYVVSKFA